MKASALLQEQHDEVRALFRALEKGNGHTDELLVKLANSLAGHMVIEQELYYPAVMRAKEDLVLEGYEEHAVARFALKRLMKTSPTDRTFAVKVKVLQEIIEDHAREEEKSLFPAAEKALGAESDALCAKMKVLFQKTVKAGYEEAAGRGGSAVTSAVAPRT